MSNLKYKLLFILGCTLVSVYILIPTFFKDSLPENWPGKKLALKQGLDLKGGVSFLMQVKTDEAVKSRLNADAQTIRAELRKEKVPVLSARALDDRKVEITLAQNKSLTELDTYMRSNFRQLQKGAEIPAGEGLKIEYQLSEKDAAEIKKNAVDQAIQVLNNRVNQFGLTEPTIQKSQDERILVQLPEEKDINRVRKSIGSVAKLEFRLVATQDRPRSQTVEFKTKDGGELTLEDEILMTGDGISKAFVEFDNNSVDGAQVGLEFTAAGARTFERITSENVDRRLAIVLDGIVQSDPNINEPIRGGRAQITGNFTTDEAHLLAIVLRAGALPAPLEFLEERVVGATLGADSITKGIYSALIGSLGVLILVPLYYRKAGLLAVGCIFLNILFLLALLALFGATLTLPGIAGLALTMGMAVDASIIIYERVREERRRGASSKAAVEAGFSRAYATIIDSNLTTLIAGIVLYAFGSGPIRGFAVTLSIGILATLFTAVFVCKAGFYFFNMTDRNGEVSI
ncbi:protein translocase subunit SecD [bacterium]|nr:protein translocase subunit SecD [bacterium]